ncbi:MAG: DUF4214 domain-containing protein [Acidimicrobiales bacterium]|nr:DUF4214 domain-containing protein [Acidimicrobiales bacterium]
MSRARTFGIDDDGEFITLLYQHALGRDPDPGGYHHWLDALSSGQVTRQRLVVLFADSDELKNRISTALGL